MHKVTFINSGGDRKPELFEAAAEGIRKSGDEAIVSTAYLEPDSGVVACWGWRMGRRMKKRGYDVLIFENGYIGDRSKWISVGWNGLNGRADFCLPKTLTGTKFKANFELKAWRPEGKYILIMGQIPNDMSLGGIDLTSFYEDVAAQAAQFYKKPVYFRPHPVGNIRGNFNPRIPKMECDLASALADAHLVITYNSNSAVDAVIAGVPALSFDIGSMAYAVTGHKVSERIMPCREKWAAMLANCQYTAEELRSGLFWRRLRKLL